MKTKVKEKKQRKSHTMIAKTNCRLSLYLVNIKLNQLAAPKRRKEKQH